MEITLYTLPPLISAILFIVLGITIFSRETDNLSKIVFALLCFATAWWQLSWFAIFNIQSEEVAVIVAKIGYSGIIFIPILFYAFFVFFCNKFKKEKRYLLTITVLGIFFLVALWMSNLVVDGVYHYSWGYYPRAGSLLVGFLLLIVFLSIRTFLLLYKKLIHFQKTSNILKYQQVQFLLLGLFVYALSSIDFLANYGFDMYPIGFIFVIFFMTIISYSVMHLQLMNVKVFVTQLASLLISGIALVNVFFAHSKKEAIFDSLFFVVVLFLSIVVTRSVRKEIIQKEKLFKLSKDLERANTELKRLDKAKSEFISIASHQLRTPLTAIKGYISLMLEGAYGKNAPETEGALNKIFLANERLIQLVEDLLNITRIESGRLEYHLEDGVQVDDIVDELKDMFILRTQEKGLEFVVKSMNKKATPIKADKAKLREVISNVIDNAIKYTNEGFVYVSIEENKRSIRVIVEDSGVGISPESLKTLFTKFGRGTDDTKIYTEGTGLGLYVGRNLIESQGGHIQVESDGMGEGSRFTIEMPIR